MKERTFQYGGLEVRLFQSDRYGWVTTTAELARGCGVTPQSLESVCKKKHLVMKESVIIDHELAKKIWLNPSRGRLPSTFWTIEGMTFVAMYMGTETCEQFRNEVLKTIKSLESQGFIGSDEIIKRLKKMEGMLEQQQKTITELKEENIGLKMMVVAQNQELRVLKSRDQVLVSNSARTMVSKRWAPKYINNNDKN